ncbi:hypothetical protein V2I01_27145 [Micromonospora sp. BRA006-A]|nr:hypothetical protein [Micromonospora sp. BRA006-A]
MRVITHLLCLPDGTPTRADIAARCADLAEALRGATGAWWCATCPR